MLDTPLASISWREFAVDMVSALAWPAVVIVALVVFRHQIRLLILALKSVKTRVLDFEFQTRVAALPDPPGTRPPVDAARPVSPRAEVLEAWIALESAIEGALARLDREEDMERNALVRPDILREARWLADAGWLDQDGLELVTDLRVLRNTAAHEPELTLSVDDAVRYRVAATTLVEWLNRYPQLPSR